MKTARPLQNKALAAALIGLPLWLVGCGQPAGAEGTAAAVAKPAPNMALLRQRAEQGDAASQAALAHALIENTTKLPDYKEAARWGEAAAAQGNADGETILGELSMAGGGVPRDPAKAVEWFGKAAGAGWAPAQYSLGFILEQGSAGRKDDARAAHWFQLAAEGGEPLAQLNYGIRCLTGKSVPKDPVEGCKWLLLAKAQGQPDAGQKADAAVAALTGSQAADARKRAAEFAPRRNAGMGTTN